MTAIERIKRAIEEKKLTQARGTKLRLRLPLEVVEQLKEENQLNYPDDCYAAPPSVLGYRFTTGGSEIEVIEVLQDPYAISTYNPCIRYDDEGEIHPDMSEASGWHSGLWVLRADYEKLARAYRGYW